MKPHHSSALAIAGLCAAILTANSAVAAEQVWRYTYNSNGQLLQSDGPRSDIADLSDNRYDAAGNLISTTNALGHTITFADYNSRGQPGRIVDANGVATSLTYHPRGWLLTSTVHDPGGDSSADAITRYEYDDEGLLVAVVAADGTRLQYAYDSARRLTQVRNDLGETIDYTLDAAGNRLETSHFEADGALSRQVSRTFDELNRLLLMSSSGGTSSRYAYDRNGNRTVVTDGNDNPRVHSFDPLNRESRVQAANGNDVEKRYDARDNLTEVIDPAQLTTSYQHDGLDNVHTLQSPDTGVSAYAYDAADNPIETRTARGLATFTQYDALQRPLNQRFADDSLDITFHYDQRSHGIGRLTGVSDATGLTQYDYDHRGNLIRSTWDTGELNLVVEYSHDLADRLTRVTYPSGRRVDYSYDAAGRVNAITTLAADGTSNTIARSVTYTPFGPVAGMELGNGVTVSAQYNLEHRLTSVTHGGVLSRDFVYDPAGNLVEINDKLNSQRNQFMAYDALNRLGAATGPFGSRSYSYDATGNRLSIDRNGLIDEYLYDTGSHHLLATSDWNFAYDADGNLVSRTATGASNGEGRYYHYDDRNRLTRVVQRELASSELQDITLATYLYNAAGQRAIKRRGESPMHYVYGPAGELLAEVDDNGLSLREYIYLDNQPVAMASTRIDQLPASPGDETLIDDNDPGNTSTGPWERVRKKGALGDYYHRSRDSGARFRWNLAGLKAARYDVYAWWPKSRKLNRSAQYAVHHSGKTTVVTANQAANGKQWVKLGTYAFAGSSDEYITLSDEGGLTAADGIRLVELVEPPPVITTGIYYFHNDHLGTPQRLTDEARNVVWDAVYHPFGKAELVTASVEQNLRFPGQYFDSESGLHYNYFRDYDPELGRYIQSDPIGLGGGVSTYAYAKNNPIRLFDPTGLLTVAEANTIGGTVGGTIGGAINGAFSGIPAGPAGVAAGLIGGGFRGAAVGALAGAAGATLGTGGPTLVGLATGGLLRAGGALASETVRYLLPDAAGTIAGGAVGGILGGASGGAVPAIGGALGGAIGGALATALCFGDTECRAELKKKDAKCP